MKEERDDEHIDYILRAYNRIYKTIGLQFLPYLPKVMSLVLNLLRAQPNVRVFGPDGKSMGFLGVF